MFSLYECTLCILAFICLGWLRVRSLCLQTYLGVPSQAPDKDLWRGGFLVPGFQVPRFSLRRGGFCLCRGQAGALCQTWVKAAGSWAVWGEVWQQPLHAKARGSTESGGRTAGRLYKAIVEKIKPDIFFRPV